MRILVVTGIFPPDSGGPASYVPEIASAFAREHQVRGVVTLSDGVNHDDSGYSFPVIRLPRAGNKLQRRISTIRTIARLAADVDVVYLNGLVLEGVLATRLICRRPTVVKVVGDLIWEQARNARATELSIDEFQTARTLPARWRALRKLQSFYTFAGDFVIVPSRYLAGIVTGWGVPSNRVKVVSNAVKAPSILDPGSPTYDVVTVARLVVWKGVEALIEVCAQRDWSLLVVGEGPLKESLETTAAQLGAKVTFTGNVPKAQVVDYIRQAKVFVLNSTYEGLPHIVLEAKLAGRPVVATAVGGTPETIIDRVDGRLIPAHDNAALDRTLAELIGDEARRLQIGEAGRADALQRVSFESMYSGTVAVLAEAAARG